MVHTNDLLNGILKNKKEIFLKTLQNAIEKVIEMHTRWSEKVKVQRRGRFFPEISQNGAPDDRNASATTTPQQRRHAA